ncbi:MAG: methyl-accepting chemotaxis protein [Gammaproteobacteria bacterium]|nr:methyl-accepting chemotaxis protein [Gammaproteobacteria bacterium]
MPVMMLAFRQQAFLIANLVNLALFVMTLGLAAYYQGWMPALLVGIPSLLFPWWLYRSFGDQLLSRLAYGISFMLFAALHIHLALGKTEVHFGIFVLLALLIAFRDWQVILTAALVIAVHHLLFMYLQFNGSPVHLVPERDANLATVIVHAIYVVIEATVLIVICKRSLREGMEGQALFDVTDKLVTNDQRILISSRAQDINSKLVNKFNQVLSTLAKTVSTMESAVRELSAESVSLLEEGHNLTDNLAKKQQAVEQIAVSTRHMSEGIAQAVQLSQQMLNTAAEASSSAKTGRSAVTATIGAIDTLTATLQGSRDKVHQMAMSTNDIKTVLEVIQSIAEQTNLLALNAAIEAARAGEQGRGFAVVADEVRTLASRTHGSTNEIKQMIARLVQGSQDSVLAVDQCLTQIEATIGYAKESDAVLDTIGQQAQQVEHSAQQMTQTLLQQDQSSQQIDHSVQQLGEMSDQQSEQGRKVLKTADHVSNISQLLREEANRFSQ